MKALCGYSAIGLLAVCVVSGNAFAMDVLFARRDYSTAFITTMLEGQGYNFTYAPVVSDAVLADQEILVFPDNRYVDDSLSDSELDAVRGFLEAGNGLLVLGETDHHGPSNLTEHAWYVGVTSAGGRYSENVTAISDHPSVAGVDTIEVYGGIALDVGDADVVARYADNSPALAAGDYGQGRWFVSGDEVWMSTDFANPTLATSVFAWLAVSHVRGDMNRDDQIDGLDVDPFVHAVIFEPFNLRADMNGDGAVTGLDVDPFVAAVVGDGTVQPIPEPSTLLLGFLAVCVVGALRKWGV